jgi:putative two-component system response regulator
MEGSPSNTVRLAAEVARTHHERWDGTGHPSGLEGVDIPAAGRIVAVAEAFCAALPLLKGSGLKGSGLNGVSSLESMATGEALAAVIAHSGTWFDPDVVRALLAIMEREHPRVVDGLRHLTH